MSDKQLLAFFEKGGEWEDAYSWLLGVAYVTKERAQEIQHNLARAYAEKKAQEREAEATSDENDPGIEWFPPDESTDRLGWYSVHHEGDYVSFTVEVVTCFEGMVPA